MSNDRNDDPEKSGESHKDPKRQGRRRRRRGGRGNQAKNGQRHNQKSGQKKSPNNRNQNNNQRRRKNSQQPRIETRDETSAGGLVVSGLSEAVRDDGHVDISRIYVALIGRLDRRNHLLWSMPKGHVESGESRRHTAEREVWEETGVEGEVFDDLGVIDYWFVSDGVRIHKTVHHHLLRYVDGDLNDEDPEVTEVAWIPFDELIEHLAYADERKLARRAHDRIPDLAREEKKLGKRTPR